VNLTSKIVLKRDAVLSCNLLIYSDYRLRIIREKAFLISQVLDETAVDASTSGLGLEGFKQLLSESKKKRDPDDSGK
jgi:hypothetical protein